MVTFLSIASSPLVSPIVPVTAKVIVSPSLASTSAWRNEPGPLSFVLVTVMVVAYTGIAAVQSSNAPIANVVARLIEPFISLCHCRVEHENGRIRRVKR
jgi:hypothetical protein